MNFKHQTILFHLTLSQANPVQTMGNILKTTTNIK
jgi:hypothetical protein